MTWATSAGAFDSDAAYLVHERQKVLRRYAWRELVLQLGKQGS